MKYLAAAALMAVLAAPLFAQDPHRNRMNETYGEVRHDERVARPDASSSLPQPTLNRMNATDDRRETRDMSGWPPPTLNRMNDPRPAHQPRRPEPRPDYPEPRL
ncbi:MAG: hypothetical protein JO332_18815 [Planctomycetaceae bacterium]|nr:hypothetical protein [Planctomycetaceae bacterium]